MFSVPDVLLTLRNRQREHLASLGVRLVCPQCERDLEEFVYLVCFTLADNVVPTRAWLHAWLWKEEGVRFCWLLVLLR